VFPNIEQVYIKLLQQTSGRFICKDSLKDV